jgi:hypothetical protein
MGFGAMGYVANSSEAWIGGAPDHTTPSKVTTHIDNVVMAQWIGTSPVVNPIPPVAQAPVMVSDSLPPAVAAAPPPPAPDLRPVYRFFDSGTTGEHFYTTDAQEKAVIMGSLPSYVYEGAPWAVPGKSAKTVDVHRFLDTVSCTHHFTTNLQEVDYILKALPAFQYEGVAFQAYAETATSAGLITLQRFFQPATGNHHFALPDEAVAIQQGWAGPGWVYEGHGFTVHAMSHDMAL